MTTNTKKITVTDIQKKKNKEPIVAITAYDALFAKIFDEVADIILVGDSLNMSFNNKQDTLSIGINEMIYHTNAVCAGAKQALIITDMPFGSYTNEDMALKNAVEIFKKTKADAVKLEGGLRVANTIKRLCDEGISVCGHIGLMPQFVRFEGGYSVKGRDPKTAQNLINDARALEAAGVFAIVLEGVVSDVAQAVSKSVNVPIIGIGSGNQVDGQILVWSDMLGFFDKFKPKFVKRYLDGANLIKNAVQNYADEVKSRAFPNEEFEYKN
ncbi:3-methyl-2-oxobutanoate hydroxymethyltransferase [Campylobacter sp. RM13119]|uniref:3-methyl-2-oxobutanoate hydroxymethyltransferase n=1 Tax=Campylobacter californiensis TaxID=1032243 RepID=UPI0014735C8E|nr:3-methyl-2-oxobutanoate hydroxymethyltransferase [Campylobacter sp. RM13119]MBE3606469.1 3-methyl-2-oxobutanoate hydroxymethyltransferase [Campylobacter sp. RM13119]